MNRAALTAHYFRIVKTYGHSPIGVRAMCRLQRMVGCESFLERILPRIEQLRPFDNVNGVRVKQRAPISGYDRERRELEARVARGERFELFTRRQAS